MRYAKLTLDQRQSIVRDYSNGIPLKELMQTYGCSLSYPSKLSRRMGVAARNPKANSRGQFLAARKKLKALIGQEANVP